MRVLLCHPSWVTETSGVGSVVTQVADYLVRHGTRVWRLQHGSTERLELLEDRPAPRVRLNLRSPLVRGSAVKSLVAFSVTWPLTQAQISAFLRREHVDVVNVHYPVDHFLYFALDRKLRLSGARLVVSLHGGDLFPTRQPARLTPWVAALLRAADAVTAPSATFLSDVLRVAPWLRARARVLHNGVHLPPASVDAQRGAGGAPYILCIAAQNEKKGLDVLVDAFAAVVTRHPRVHLVLAGDGPLRADRERQAERLGLKGRVQFLGRCDRARIAQLLSGCELFVLPSRAEAFGIAAVEAMACGKPVVVSAVGGLKEIVEDRVTGVLVPPGDITALATAMTQLLDDPASRERLGLQGAASVACRFSTEALGGRYEALYRDVSCGKMEALRGEVWRDDHSVHEASRPRRR